MKWFTYANFSSNIRTYGSHKAISKGWFSREGSYNNVALVFGSDNPKEEPTLEDVQALARNPEVQKFVGRVFFALRVRNLGTGTYLVFTEHPDLIIDPDQAKLDEPPVFMYVDGVERIYYPRQRYSDCRTLLKVLGCAKCPDKGWVCHSRALLKPEEANEEIAVLREYDKTTPEDLQEYFKHGVSKLEDYTYASPVMTKPLDVQGVNFLRAARSVREHDFGAIKHWSSQRTDAAVKASESRRFRKKQCAKCVLNRCGCHSYRYCEGRYPSPAVMVDHIMKQWRPRMRVLPKGIKPWQFWVVAQCAGATSKYGRRNVMLAGMRWERDAGVECWKISVQRSKTYISEELSSESYKEVAAIFDLPATRKEAIAGGYKPTPPKREALAMWFKTQELFSGYRRGWGGTNDILVRILTKHGAALKFTNGRYIFGDMNIHCFQDIYTKLEKDLGVPHLNGRRIKRGTGG